MYTLELVLSMARPTISQMYTDVAAPAVLVHAVMLVMVMPATVLTVVPSALSARST